MAGFDEVRFCMARRGRRGCAGWNMARMDRARQAGLGVMFPGKVGLGEAGMMD